MEFSRPEYWSGQPFPSPGEPPDPGIEPGSPALQADSLPTYPGKKGWRVITVVDLGRPWTGTSQGHAFERLDGPSVTRVW